MSVRLYDCPTFVVLPYCICGRIPITGLNAFPLLNITSTSEFRHKHALPSNLQLMDYCCSCRSESATCYQSLRKQPIDGHTEAVSRARP